MFACGIQATWYLYDAHSLQPLGSLDCGGAVGPRWNVHDPNPLYSNDEMRLMAYNSQTPPAILVHDCAADFP